MTRQLCGEVNKRPLAAWEDGVIDTFVKNSLNDFRLFGQLVIKATVNQLLLILIRIS